MGEGEEVVQLQHTVLEEQAVVYSVPQPQALFVQQQVDGERRPGFVAVGHNVLQAAEQILLVAFAEHTEQEELQVQSLLCYVALEVVALVVLVQMALKELVADAWVGVVGGEEEIGFFVIQ